MNGTAIHKTLVGHFGEGTDAPAMHVNLYLPANATGPVPVVLSISFGFSGGPPPPRI